VKRFLRRLWDTFVRGLLAILPVGATFYILWLLYHLIDGLVGKETAFGQMVERALGHWIPGLGIYVTILLILLIGLVTRNILGRTIQLYMERIFFSLPGVRKMYATLKQFTTALLSRDTSSFQKVVTFDYPRKGIRVLGLVTNEEVGKLQKEADEDYLLVYVPTAPNPLSGMMLVVPEREVAYVDIPVEDALSMVLSSGSVLPESLQDRVPDKDEPRIRLFRRG